MINLHFYCLNLHIKENKNCLIIEFFFLFFILFHREIRASDSSTYMFVVVVLKDSTFVVTSIKSVVKTWHVIEIDPFLVRQLWWITARTMSFQQTSSSTTTTTTTLPSAPRYRVYKRRWLLLLAASLLNLTNAFNWLTFAPIATFSAQFYNVSAADVDWFGNAFFIAGKC